MSIDADSPALKPKGAEDGFHKFSAKVASSVGSSMSFIAALMVVAVWAVSGPVFHFSDTWQLVINTGTTIVTFLMVFLIQNTQNRDARAMHLKLDELIYATKRARNLFLDLETLSTDELDRLEQEFKLQRMKKLPAEGLKKRVLIGSSSLPPTESKHKRRAS
ncbi:MAG: low affinity iron permease family protein [Polyangiaceae bacterium]